MPIYYFGYGSNMSAAVMAEWCPTHKLIGAAHLPDYKLAFTRLSQRWGAGVADIVPERDGIVWGGLYAINEDDLSALDRKEGNGSHYQRTQCYPVIGKRRYDAFTYNVIDKAPNPIPTSIAYRDTMLTGARELALPATYIAHIADLPLSD